jgi:hypothetical protein
MEADISHPQLGVGPIVAHQVARTSRRRQYEVMVQEGVAWDLAAGHQGTHLGFDCLMISAWV